MTSSSFRLLLIWFLLEQSDAAGNDRRGGALVADGSSSSTKLMRAAVEVDSKGGFQAALEKNGTDEITCEDFLRDNVCGGPDFNRTRFGAMPNWPFPERITCARPAFPDPGNAAIEAAKGAGTFSNQTCFFKCCQREYPYVPTCKGFPCNEIVPESELIYPIPNCTTLTDWGNLSSPTVRAAGCMDNDWHKCCHKNTPPVYCEMGVETQSYLCRKPWLTKLYHSPWIECPNPQNIFPPHEEGPCTDELCCTDGTCTGFPCELWGREVVANPSDHICNGNGDGFGTPPRYRNFEAACSFPDIEKCCKPKAGGQPPPELSEAGWKRLADWEKRPKMEESTHLEDTPTAEGEDAH